MVNQNSGMFLGPALFGFLVEHLGWVNAGYCLIPVCIFDIIAAWKVNAR
jgi:MFS family permease